MITLTRFIFSWQVFSQHDCKWLKPATSLPFFVYLFFFVIFHSSAHEVKIAIKCCILSINAAHECLLHVLHSIKVVWTCYRQPIGRAESGNISPIFYLKFFTDLSINERILQKDNFLDKSFRKRPETCYWFLSESFLFVPFLTKVFLPNINQIPKNILYLLFLMKWILNIIFLELNLLISTYKTGANWCPFIGWFGCYLSNYYEKRSPI